MKKAFLLLLILIVAVAAKFAHTRFFVQQTFGPSSMLAVAILVSVAIILIVSYLFVDGNHREKVISFWLISVSTLATYFVVDLLAGYMLIVPLSPELIPDETRHHKLVPNAYAKFEQKDFSYVQRNNDLGLRGAEISASKPASTYRILMLGDSFTMGKGVQDSQTFSFLLEQILDEEVNECGSRYQDVQILNGGVDSYSPILSYLYLKDSLAALEPDMVILNLDNSDLLQEQAYRSVAVRDKAGNIIAVPGSRKERPFSDKMRSWIESNLYITRLLLFYTNQLMGHKDLTVRGVVTSANAEVLLHTLMSDKADRIEQWGDLFHSLGMINSFASERSMEFVLSVYPWGHQVNDYEWTPGRYAFLSQDDKAIQEYDKRILSLARSSGIDAISVYDAFLAHEGPDKLYFDNDMHLTPSGHELMAKGIAASLEDSGHSRSWCK